MTVNSIVCFPTGKGGKNRTYASAIPLDMQHENANDVAYWKVLVDAAEQFFNRMIKEMEQVCIKRIIEAFIPGSISSQLTKKSFLDYRNKVYSLLR